MLNIFLQYLQSEKRYSAHTIRAYKSDLEQLIKDLRITEDQLAALTHRELRLWCSSLMEQGLNARSVNRKISAVSAFYGYLVRQNIIEQNPADKVINPKNRKRLPFFYEESQMQTLLDGEVESSGYAAQRNHAIMELFYGTGIRLSELIGLRLADIDLDRRIVKVMGKGSKERIVPLSPHLIRELEQYLDVYGQHFDMPPSNPLFLTHRGKALYSSLVYRIVHQTLKNQGINGKKSPHVLRHTFATHLLNRGADLNSIKTLLGHTSLSATQVYTHNDIDKLLRSYSQAHPHA